MKRPYIPVRDGWRGPKMPQRTYLPEPGENDYRAGFWLGYTAGLCWGAILTAVLLKVIL